MIECIVYIECNSLMFVIYIHTSVLLCYVTALHWFLIDFSFSADKCKVMDSKMKPLWLNFENLDPLGKSILQIFKNGDGKWI